MESPFSDIPVSMGKSFNQWDNKEEEIMTKNPLLDPGQAEFSTSESSFENISKEVDEYLMEEFETSPDEAYEDGYKSESTIDNELALFETDFYNEEAEIEYDAPATPPTAPVASPSCDLSIAVTPFEISQTQKIDPDLLSPLKNKKAIEWNTAFLKKIKIDPKDVLTDLQRYVDIAYVKNVIDAYNKAHSSAMIEAGTFPVNAIFAEAVHQFQKKIYFDASSIDGKSGPGTLHSIGIISFPQDPRKLAANDGAKKELKNLKIKVLINGTECNYKNWFNFTYNPSFLGKSFNRPVHYLLIRQLRIAEKYLLNSARFKGNNLVEMGSKLGLSKDTEEHAGGRFSGGGMHTFGLALDINHNNNPWIGAGWISKPKKEIYDKLSEAKRKRLDTVLNEKYKILEDLKKASGQKLYGNKISVYLDHVGQTKGADTNDAYKELKQRNDEFIAYLKANPSEWSYWKKSATFQHGSSINGFLNLDKDLVYALRQIGNLAWGAIDFGPGEGANGDMMHFDLRTLPIGRKINLCKSAAGGDSLKTHPNLKGAIDQKAVCATIEKEDYDYNNEGYENWENLDEPELLDFENKNENFLNAETDFEVDRNEITDEFDEAYEGEIEEAYEGEKDGEFAEDTDMEFEETNDYEDEFDQDFEKELEEDVPESTEVVISNEYTVDEKKGITGYLNVSAIKNRPLRTGVFIPAGFTPGNKVDLILYLHGLFDYGSYKYGMAYYWKNYSNIREHFYEGNRNAILIAPALGSNPQVTDLIFKYQKGLDQFIAACIEELIARNHLPAGAEPGKVILAAHSAGGYPMSAILRTENKLMANIDECWCFDCFYNYGWEKVLEKNSGILFYHYWAYTSNGKMSGPGGRGEALAKTYRNLKNIQPAKGIHHREVIEYAWKNEINKRAWFRPIGSASSTITNEVKEYETEYIDTEDDNSNFVLGNTDEVVNQPFQNDTKWPKVYENEFNEEALIEGLLPAVSQSDIRSRLDDYLNQSNAEYTLDTGTVIRARHAFSYGYGVTSILDKLKSKIKTQLGSSVYYKLQRKGNPIITMVLYGRGKPGELKQVTQAIINSSSDIFADADDIRAQQREFRIGIDCAGYVQLAFFYSIYGHDNDTPSRRRALGLDERRGSERLENLGTANFTEVGILKAQPGDLMVMNPREKSETDHSFLDSDHSMHTVIVVEHKKSGDIHEYIVDASWGNDAYGSKFGGVGRRTLCYNEATKEWWDIHPGSGVKISGYKFVKSGTGWAIVGAEPVDPDFHSTAKLGPYLGHKIKGVYRPILKPTPAKETPEETEFEFLDKSEFDNPSLFEITPFEHDIPTADSTGGGVTVPSAKKIPQPLIIIKPVTFTWRGKSFSLREAGIRKYAVKIGCLPKDVSVFYDFTGQVFIRSESTGEEIPYTPENYKLNFPGGHFFTDIEILPGKNTNFTFSTRPVNRIDKSGRFESKGNNIQLGKAKDTITFWFVVSDPGHRHSAPKGTATSLVFETISTDIPGLCEEAEKAENAAIYYSDWYRKQIEKTEPLNANSQIKAIAFDAKELGDINYYLRSVGLRLDSKGFLNLIPGWQSPDYWSWKGRHSIWNGRQFLTNLNPSVIADKLLFYKSNFFIGKEKPLPFYVFIGELRRFEDLNAGDIDIEEQIRRLRRCGHESSLIFDEVLNLPVGDKQHYSNNKLGGSFQFLKDHNRIDVHGHELDFWHLFVGLDALSRDKGKNDTVNLLKLPVAQYTQMERAAAATWAGDIGSALTDWMVRFSQDQENKNNFKTLESRLDYYWKSRASTADLEGEILAWGIYDLRKSFKSQRLSDVLLYFFHPAQFLKNRRKAFELFIKHYSLPGKPADPDIPRLEKQISEFAKIWNLYRFWYSGKSRAYTDADYEWGLAELVSKFILYLEAQLK